MTAMVSLTDEQKVVVIEGAPLLRAMLDQWIAQLPADFTGPQGTTGPANSSYPTVAAVEAADTSNLSAILAAAGKQGLFVWTGGDFSGQSDGSNVVQSSGTSLSTGAWVRLRYDQLWVDGEQSVTVGAAGRFPTLVAALDWVKRQALNRPTRLLLLEKDIGGSMTIPATGYTLDHPNARNLYIEGPAFGAGQGPIANDAMTGNAATDRAYILARYGASIRFDGAGTDAGTFGLACPFGIGGVKRIAFECLNRYNFDICYNGAHSAATGGGAAVFEDCAWFGGVWGLIAYRSQITMRGTNFFGYQRSAGPIALFDCGFETDVSTLNLYTPFGTPSALKPQYGLFVQGGKLSVNATQPTAGRINIKGSFLHGIWADQGAGGAFMLANFDGVSQPLSIGDASIDIGGGTTIANADPASTTQTPGAQQPGPPGNSAAGALISVGPGGNLRHNGITISGCKCASYINLQGGAMKSYGLIAINDSKATLAAVQVSGSKGNQIRVKVTNPQPGSLDQSIAQENGDLFFYAANDNGLSYAPALNTVVKGSGNFG